MNPNAFRFLKLRLHDVYGGHHARCQHFFDRSRSGLESLGQPQSRERLSAREWALTLVLTTCGSTVHRMARSHVEYTAQCVTIPTDPPRSSLLPRPFAGHLEPDAGTFVLVLFIAALCESDFDDDAQFTVAHVAAWARYLPSGPGRARERRVTSGGPDHARGRSKAYEQFGPNTILDRDARVSRFLLAGARPRALDPKSD
jgi:hypothetical protein